MVLTMSQVVQAVAKVPHPCLPFVWTIMLQGWMSLFFGKLDVPALRTGPQYTCPAVWLAVHAVAHRMKALCLQA